MARYRKKSQRVISQVLESFWSPQFFYKETPKTFDDIESHYHSPADTTSTPTQWGTDSKAEQTNSGYRRYAKADRKAPSPQSCKATIWSESTPKTLESMLVEYEQHQAQDSKVETTVSPFFRLPREIRDVIYRYVLVPNTPIELAPFMECICTQDEWCERLYRNGVNLIEDIEGDIYHKGKWDSEYRHVPAFLRVCPQIYHEASPIYYGQPFRFSCKAGWVVLYFWLRNIGTRNRNLVKDVTVCHPAMAQTRCLLKHLSAFKIPMPRWDIYNAWVLGGNSFESCPKSVFTQGLDIEQRWPGWTTIPHTASMLAEMKGLKNLCFLIKRSRMYKTRDDDYEFPILAHHAVHAYLKERRPETKLSIVNFITSWDNTDEAFSLEATYDPESPHESRINQEAREFFDHVKEIGWDVVEMRYDGYETYPVPVGVGCGNTEVRDFVEVEKNWM